MTPAHAARDRSPVDGPRGAGGTRAGWARLRRGWSSVWRGRWLRRGVVLAVLLLVVEYGLVPQVAGARETARLLTQVRPAYLVVAVLAEVASLLAWSVLTRAMFAAVRGPSLFTALRVDLTTLAVNHVVPGGGATGAALRYRLLTGTGVAGADVVFGTLVQSVGSAIVLNVLLWVTLVPAIPRYGLTPFFAVAASLGAALFAMAVVIVFALGPRAHRTTRLVRTLFGHLPGVSAEAVQRQLRRIAADLARFGRDRPLLVRAVLLAASNWLFDALSLWIFVAAFGDRADVDGLLIAYGLANVLAALPITPGGLGIVEGVLVPTLVAAGSPHGAAILGVLAWRLVNFWLPIPVGVLAFLSLRTGALRGHPLPRRWPWRNGHVPVADSTEEDPGSHGSPEPVDRTGPCGRRDHHDESGLGRSPRSPGHARGRRHDDNAGR